MYSLLVLAVIASYLCLVAWSQSPRPVWAIAYGLAVAVAVYVDYSAIYALAPQVVLLVALVRRGGHRLRYLAAAIIGAVLIYLPWLPQVNETIANSRRYDGGGREYLKVTWENGREAALYLLGFENYGSRRHYPHPSAWDHWPDARPWLLLSLIPIVVVGVLALRRAPRALTVTLLLLVGTVVATIALSQLSPGFAARTMLAAVPGWALLASASFARPAVGGRESRWLRRIGVAGWCAMLAVSLATLPTVYFNGSRNEFPRLAADLASQIDLGKPIVLPSTAGMLTDVMDVYEHDALARARVITLVDGPLERETGGERWLNRGPTMDDVRHGRLGELLPSQDPSSDAVWFVRRFNAATVEQHLAELGYERVTVVQYYRTQLVLYARPGAVLGAPIDRNGDVLAIGEDASGWKLPATGVRVESAQDGDGDVLVFAGAEKKLRATRRVEQAVPGLYSLTVETRGGDAGGATASATLACVSASGATLRKYSGEGSPAADPDAWSPLRVAVLCPSGTTAVTVTLSAQGQFEVAFRRPQLSLSPSADEPARGDAARPQLAR
jgi:hypothetical protein